MMQVHFVVGPTASGKSDYALTQALAHNGCIINCDSIQLYKHVKIGASLPSQEDFLKVPHFLYSYVDYPREMTAGEYARDFNALLDKISQEKLYQNVYVVGGTGFYFLAIEKGMYPVQHVDPEIQKQVVFELSQVGGVEKLYQEMQNRDPEFSQKISINDKYRIERSIALMRSENKSITLIQQELSQVQKKFAYPLKKIGIKVEREKLRSRVQKRTHQMLQQGLVDEVQKLVELGYQDWQPLNSVGYKETKEYLLGHLSLEQLQDLIVKNTMALAKKQMTWFKRDTEIQWLENN